MARRALVVEDDPLVLELVVSMLEELGCETILARSGSEALGQLSPGSKRRDIGRRHQYAGAVGSSTSGAGVWFSA